MYFKDDKLKYEGEFLNGKKNGKGVEYERFPGIKYVGEFLNGKKNGKIKEYDFHNYYHSVYDKGTSKLIFEGEYLNNYKIRGKEYYKNGKLFFEGEYLFTKKWNGKIYDYNGNILFELKNGNGIIEDSKYNNKITIFIGENLDDKIIWIENVKVKEYDYNGRLLFEGEYLLGGKWKGKIKKYYKDELIFEGEYLDGEIWNGKGKEVDSRGNIIFEGEYINGEKMDI